MKIFYVCIVNEKEGECGCETEKCPMENWRKTLFNWFYLICGGLGWLSSRSRKKTFDDSGKTTLNCLSSPFWFRSNCVWNIDPFSIYGNETEKNCAAVKTAEVEYDKINLEAAAAGKKTTQQSNPAYFLKTLDLKSIKSGFDSDSDSVSLPLVPSFTHYVSTALAAISHIIRTKQDTRKLCTGAKNIYS